MNVYRAEVHGHLIEARSTGLGAERVLVDGEIVSSRWLTGLWPASHFFCINDETGGSRHIEVCWTDVSKLGLGKYRVVISVDGMERWRLEPVDISRPANACPHCGYSLHGLPVDNSEIRCPECGRHSSAILAGAVSPQASSLQAKSKPR